jgi:hypothetical protein
VPGKEKLASVLLSCPSDDREREIFVMHTFAYSLVNSPHISQVIKGPAGWTLHRILRIRTMFS